MEIRIAEMADLQSISNLANEIWPLAYADVISKEQISLMLAEFYTLKAIENQIGEGHVFFILEHDGVSIGFASISSLNHQLFKLQKLYIHQNLHGQGAGKLMVQKVENYCRSQNATELILNVNRNNEAQHFYKKIGFEIIESVDIPYHQFVLNDYIMRKSLI